MCLPDLLRLGRIAAIVVAAVFIAWHSARAQSAALLRFSLDWKLEGPAAIFLVPQERGYFREVNLDVSLDEGSTTLDPISRVASGSHDIGLADINALIKYREQHPAAPVKAIFMLYNKPPYAIVTRKTRGITEPKQLEGKKLGAPPTGTTFGEWPLFAKLNDIDASKVAIEQIGIPVRAPMLAAGQIDAALGYSFRIYVDVKERGVQVDDIVLMPMANYKMKLYGSAIIVNTKFAAEKPELIRRYIPALLHGMRDTIRNPSTAVDLVLRRDDSLKKEVELDRVRMAINDNIVTPEVRANGFGVIDPARFDEAVGQLTLTNTFKAKPKIEDVFDGSFLPPLADRRVN